MNTTKKKYHEHSDRKVPKTLTLDESEQLLKQLLEDMGDHKKLKIRLRNTTLALLMLDAGLRVNEARNLLVQDLTINKEPVQTLTVPAACAKNHKAREIPLTIRLKKYIWEMQDAWWEVANLIGYDFAFRGERKSKPLTTRQIENIISKAGYKGPNKKVTPHMLRHTFASRLIRKTNSRVVQELLGHSSLSSTQIYLHPNSDDLKLAIAGLENEV